MQQRAERLNAAYELRDRHGAAKAVRLLAERYALSPVQTRRYVRAAGDMDAPLPDADIKQPITVRVPQHLVEQLPMNGSGRGCRVRRPRPEASPRPTREPRAKAAP